MLKFSTCILSEYNSIGTVTINLFIKCCGFCQAYEMLCGKMQMCENDAAGGVRKTHRFIYMSRKSYVGSYIDEQIQNLRCVYKLW